MHTLELAGNKIRRSSVSHIADILLRRQLLILKPLDSKLSNDKKEILIWRNALLKQVEGYVDINLNPSKVTLCEKCPNTDFPLVYIFLYSD